MDLKQGPYSRENSYRFKFKCGYCYTQFSDNENDIKIGRHHLYRRYDIGFIAMCPSCKKWCTLQEMPGIVKERIENHDNPYIITRKCYECDKLSYCTTNDMKPVSSWDPFHDYFCFCTDCNGKLLMEGGNIPKKFKNELEKPPKCCIIT